MNTPKKVKLSKGSETSDIEGKDNKLPIGKPSRQQLRAVERDLLRVKDRLFKKPETLEAVALLQREGFTPGDYKLALHLVAYFTKKVKNAKSE
jgi:hypothetical protein